MKTIYRLVLVALIAVTGSLVLLAQETGPAPSPEPTTPFQVVQAPRTLGSQIFQIDLGLMIPLFSHNSDGTVFKPGAIMDLGGAGRLRWGAYITQFLAFGIDLSGAINGGPNTKTTGNTIGLFNVGPHVTTIFRLGNFQLPVSLTPAFSVLSYAGSSYVGFTVKPGLGIYYDATPNWSFGLDLSYWWVPELYAAGGTPSPVQNRFGNLLEVSISALYSF